MRIHTALLLLLLPSLTACAPRQHAVSDPLAGCYAVELGPWSRPPQPADAPYLTPPDAFRLTREAGSEAFERGRLLARPRIPHGRSPSAFWEPVGTDSVRVVWTSGFVGVQLHLQIAGDSLVGRAQTFTDVIVEGGPPPPHAEIVARRTRCDVGATMR